MHALQTGFLRGSPLADTKKMKARSLGISQVIHENFSCIPRSLPAIFHALTSCINASNGVTLSSYIMVIYFNVLVM